MAHVNGMSTMQLIHSDGLHWRKVGVHVGEPGAIEKGGIHGGGGRGSIFVLTKGVQTREVGDIARVNCPQHLRLLSSSEEVVNTELT